MTTNTKKPTKTEAVELYKQIAALLVAYGKEGDEPTLMAYRIGLEDLPLAKVESAVAQAIRNGGEFLPTVSAIRRLAGAELSTKSRSVVAFDALGDAVTQYGAYKSVRFTDPILNQTIQSLGGWVTICGTSLDDWDSHFRRRFMEVYAGNLEAKRGTMYAQLGIAEINNNAAALPSPTPALIAVDVPTLPNVSHIIPEQRNHLLRSETKLLTDFGKIGETT
jgi:hypothetical protein